LSDKLSREIGGWIFHSPVDFNVPTPHVNVSTSQPALMSQDD